MRRFYCRTIALTTAAFLLTVAAHAQLPSPNRKPVREDSPYLRYEHPDWHPSVAIALTYTAQQTKFAGSNGKDFWLQGGGMNMGVNLYHGFGPAINVISTFKSDVVGDVDLYEVTFLGGLRYTWGAPYNRSSGRPLHIFAEGLYGQVIAYNTIFPTTYGTPTTSATTGSLQAGGGLDLMLKHHLGVRLIEGDYVRTTLPDSAQNVQHNLRLTSGLSLHF